MSEKKTSIGGQALIEGIMMRGPNKVATVVRRVNGETVCKETEFKPITERSKLIGLPFIRGVIGFIEMLSVGTKELFYSADIATEDETMEPDKFDLWLKKTFGDKGDKVVMGFAMFIGILIPIGLFILLPTFLAGLIEGFLPHPLLRNAAEGVLRLCIFLFYLFVMSKIKDMRRVFSYHGAEHKTIFCYEAGLPLTVENVRNQKKEHPRCGTSFLFVVMIISIVIFSFTSWTNPWVRMGFRLLLLPVVVAISYEINRLVGRHDNFLTRFLRAPGVLLQKMTTFEPDDSMIEVAIEALEKVIPEDETTDKW